VNVLLQGGFHIFISDTLSVWNGRSTYNRAARPALSGAGAREHIVCGVDEEFELEEARAWLALEH
jgi:hypothetical protein